MADLKTTYMGLELKNPIIAGASDLTANIKKIESIEAAGAGALVIKSLFEEQIQLEIYKFEEELHKNDELHAEMTSIFPRLEHAGPAEHLMWVRKAKDAVSIPIIASLNAVNKETWVEYAQRLSETGVDGLELNFYSIPTTNHMSAAEIEDSQIDILESVKSAVSIPVSVKLSHFYTNPLHFIARLDVAGADAIVIFNQLFQPEIDAFNEKQVFSMTLSDEKDHRLPLRFAGLLYGVTNSSICASSGIYTGADVIKMLLAGANCVQVVSTLYKHKIDYISTLLNEINQWMDDKGYASVDDFVGKLSRMKSNDPWAYKRAQYAKMLLKQNPLG
ncbi:dihydroorotate dehydrogenase-like protein [candidate division KSB1 bacterium]|nr:dihydroorotate dehydrogenase-like protein [candidate division KSB1 bacterium]